MILAGVRAVTIHDTKAVETRDLGAQFYLTQEDVGQNRAEACRDKLQELNTAVEVTASSQDLTADFVGGFQVRRGRRRRRRGARTSSSMARGAAARWLHGARPALLKGQHESAAWQPPAVGWHALHAPCSPGPG